MMEQKRLSENSTNILERDVKPERVYENMKGCVPEANLEGQVW